MEEFDNPVIDEDEISDSRKNKIIMFAIIILGTIFVVKFKEIAFFILLFSLPITFLSFFVALIVIFVRFTEPIESLSPSERSKLEKANPQIDYTQTNVNVLNKKGVRKLKSLGIIFLSYVILGGIAYIMMILSGF